MLRPDDSDASENLRDRVKSIEWDPLSTDYLLVSTAQRNIMLVDSNTASILTYFELPSAAAEVHSLAWIPSAPGMFLSGGKLVLSQNCYVWSIYLNFVLSAVIFVFTDPLLQHTASGL